MTQNTVYHAKYAHSSRKKCKDYPVRDDYDSGMVRGRHTVIIALNYKWVRSLGFCPLPVFCGNWTHCRTHPQEISENCGQSESHEAKTLFIITSYLCSSLFVSFFAVSSAIDLGPANFAMRPSTQLLEFSTSYSPMQAMNSSAGSRSARRRDVSRCLRRWNDRLGDFRPKIGFAFRCFFPGQKSGDDSTENLKWLYRGTKKNISFSWCLKPILVKNGKYMFSCHSNGILLLRQCHWCLASTHDRSK